MVRRYRFAGGPLAALAASALFVAADAADVSPSGGGGTSDGMVHWIVPPTATHIPQTEEQKEESRRAGRALPTPEVLQPMLDPALQPYQPRSKAAVTGTFQAASSDVLVDLMQRWLKRFATLQPGVRITLAPPFAGSLGAKELIKENVAFVACSRELKPDDLTEFRARFGYDPTSIPISGGSYRQFGFLDAIGFIVHPDNPIDRLDFRQLDAILSTTRAQGSQPLRTWGQLGLTGEWADKAIHIYGPKPWNGFEEFVRQRVLSVGGKRGEWRDDADVRFSALVYPIAAQVAADRYGIGYTGLAYLDRPVKVLPLSKSPGGPYVAPTYENVALASYPLSRLTYFSVNKPPGKPLPAGLEEFLRFVLSRDGQQVVQEQGIYMPLRSSQVQESLSMLSP